MGVIYFISVIGRNLIIACRTLKFYLIKYALMGHYSFEILTGKELLVKTYRSTFFHKRFLSSCTRFQVSADGASFVLILAEAEPAGLIVAKVSFCCFSSFFVDILLKTLYSSFVITKFYIFQIYLIKSFKSTAAATTVVVSLFEKGFFTISLYISSLA